ncbi:helix-turn-helix domain-containing protein [Sphingobium agri]|uniref:helix-turn-helix domain-containing protein n=1 Tax=Sphingobium TaxID=165695 RepID=UPI001FF308D2|nr:helix-turn-helix domain-containing protein [Sphingobium agri]
MATASDIIAALGGTSAVARELELPPSTVSSWKTGARIPKWRMQGINSLAARLGVDLSNIDKAADKTGDTSASPGKKRNFAAPESEAA